MEFLLYSSFNAFGQVFTFNPIARGIKGVCWAKSQYQVYFFNKYLYKVSNPDSDTGRWYHMVLLNAQIFRIMRTQRRFQTQGRKLCFQVIQSPLENVRLRKGRNDDISERTI